MSLTLNDSIENCQNTINKLFKIQKQIVHCRKNNIENYKHYENVQIQNNINENEKILSDLYPPPQNSSNVNHEHTSLDRPQIVTSEDSQGSVILVSKLYDLLNYMKENNVETFHYDKIDIDELQMIIDHNNDLIF